jgi:para-aminobenzoate synthetase
MKTLLIDNYDSFTYNLFQLLGEVNGEPPEVVRNDEASWDELARRDFDNVVISPGPGRPDDRLDFGLCADAIRHAKAPLLGVCLGHQGLCWAFGGRVERAPEAVHGRVGAVIHDGSPLFAGIPREFQAVRYHSLCVAGSLPDELKATAWASDGVLMGVAHRRRPLWGVQFHPESISTEHGRRLLANFRDLTRAHAPGSSSRRADRGRNMAATGPDGGSARPWAGFGHDAAATGPGRPGPMLLVERLETFHDPERAFGDLYADSENAFWLDSSRHDGRSRFSFIGDDGGPFGAAISYDVAAGEVSVARGEATTTHRETIFDYLRRETRRLRHLAPDDLPFDLACGFAGYLGYELKADCGGDLAHESPLPDAAFVFAGRMLAFDHREGHTYLLCLADAASAAAGRRWLADVSERLAAPAPPGDSPTPAQAEPVEFRLARSRERYLDDIAACKELLLDGETYEVCLTNRIEADVAPDPLSTYRALRRVNPAPFAAYLSFGGFAVLSSSPERFLRVERDGWAEAKPIKGTSRRGATAVEDVRRAERLRTSEKNRAENLMITDLLRNDLGRVCDIGTVHVPHLMQVETYETVHQIVSTVRGLLRPGVDAPGCVRACFPPGSMTGAPKKRTMEIIDELERDARGVYSGAIGYFGLGGGCDLSVVIRTVVIDGETTTIGVGGAIVTLSDPDDEYREALLKGEAPMRAIDVEAAEAAATGSLDSNGCQPATPRP